MLLPKTTTHDLIRWCLYALVILVPTVYTTALNSAFTMPKLVVIRVITLLIVLIWGTQIVAQKKLNLRHSPMNPWIAAVGVMLGITTLFSSHPWVSAFGDQDRFLGLFTMLNMLFLLVVTMNFVQTKQEVHRMLTVSVGTAIALSVYGLLQFKGMVGVENWDHDPTLRVFGTMGHSNHFGAYLGMHILLLLGLWLTAKQRSIRIGYAIGLLPMVGALIATASRGAFFALLVSGGIFAAVLMWDQRAWIRMNRKKIISVAVAGLILMAIFAVPIKNRLVHLNLTQRTIESVEFIRQGNIPDRVSWWFSSWAMLRDKPIFGHGLSTFRDTYNLYRRTDYRVPGDEQDRFTPETAHMEYFNIAATQGIVGLLVFLGFLAMAFRLLFRIMRANPDGEQPFSIRVTAYTLFAAALAYYVQLLMSFEVIGTLMPMMLLWGTAFALYHMTADPKPQSQQFATISIQGFRLGGGVALVGVVWILSAWLTARGASAELYSEQAERQRLAKEVNQMMEWNQKTVNAMPWMYQYWIDQGEGAFEFGTYEGVDVQIAETLIKTSMSAYQRAYALMKNQPYIQGNLALAYVVYADILETKGIRTEAGQWRNKSIELYREAVRVGVNNPRFTYTLGKLLLSLKRENEAGDAFLYALEIREPFLDTYYYLATIATNRKEYETARMYIQKAIQQDPSDERVKTLLQRINAETDHTPPASP